jgi:hypothetical protein
MPRSVAQISQSPWSLLALAFVSTLLWHHPAAAAPIPGTTEAQTVLIIVGALAVIFAGIGAYMIYSGISNRAIARASETWPTAGGKVLGSEVEKRAVRHRKTNTTTYYYTPKIRYSYRVGGADYESSIVRFGELARNSKTLADELVAKYPAGATIAVRFDPDDPRRATLESESAGGRQMLTGAVFIAVPLFVLGIAGVIIGFGGPADLPSELADQLNKSN